MKDSFSEKLKAEGKANRKEVAPGGVEGRKSVSLTSPFSPETEELGLCFRVGCRRITGTTKQQHLPNVQGPPTSRAISPQ